MKCYYKKYFSHHHEEELEFSPKDPQSSRHLLNRTQVNLLHNESNSSNESNESTPGLCCDTFGSVMLKTCTEALGGNGTGDDTEKEKASRESRESRQIL